jgi:hypothetical protein
MCRFSSKEDDGYRKISRELLLILQRIKGLRERKQDIENNVWGGGTVKCKYLADVSRLLNRTRLFMNRSRLESMGGNLAVSKFVF